MILSTFVNHPKVEGLYNPLLDHKSSIFGSGTYLHYWNHIVLQMKTTFVLYHSE